MLKQLGELEKKQLAVSRTQRVIRIAMLQCDPSVRVISLLTLPPKLFKSIECKNKKTKKRGRA